MRAFLDWAVATARPEEGAPKVLLAIAKLAEATWVDGTLYIDIAGDDSVTKISIFADYGFGIRERLLPLARLPVPFDEFVRAVKLSPKLIAPLRGQHLADLARAHARPTTISTRSKAAISIAESSMLDDALKMLDDPRRSRRQRTAPPPSGFGQIGK